MSTPIVKSSWKVFDGNLTKYQHASTSTNTDMIFSVFMPSTAAQTPAPVIYWLSGLTCTDDNFAQKATVAFKVAQQHNVAIVLPDTSPRGANCPGDKENWDFGEGAGFYLNATVEPFNKYYNMYDYVTNELPSVVSSVCGSLITSDRSIMGHSMGGHGALTLYLKSGLYKSCSAFAPICNPVNCPWGVKAFTGYLGSDQSLWSDYDATALVRKFTGDKTVPIVIEQGAADNFLKAGQLLPDAFLQAAKEEGVNVEYNLHEGYDHSYFFITSFIEKHVAFHAKHLKQ